MIKKLTSKKVNVFGKGIPLFVIALLGLVVVSAALLPYFGKITGSAVVTQGLLVDHQSMPNSGNLVDAYDDFTSLESPVYVNMHELENNANVQANGNITSTCSATTNCTGVDYRAVEYFDSAGADFSGYIIDSSSCTVNVTSGNSIQDAINSASIGSGDVVCVKAGSYTGDLNINKDITLVALVSPTASSHVVLNGGVQLTADGAKLEGFEINTGRLSSGDRVGVSVYASNTEVLYNVIDGIKNPSTGRTTHGIHIFDAGSDILVRNNLIENVNNTDNGGSYGIMVQANSDDVNITQNTIQNITGKWVGGISASPSNSASGLPDGLSITENEFKNLTGNTYPALGFYTDSASGASSNGTLDPVVDASQVTFEYNNLEDSVAVDLGNQNTAKTLVAKDNWYGTNGLSIYGKVDATWMTKTSFSIVPNGVDKFATLAAFQKMLKPDTFTVTTKVTA